MTFDRPNEVPPPPAGVEVPVTRVGDIIAGKYQVQRVLGRGGMGVVVAAMHVYLQERVALKILSPSIAADPESRARFLREARVTARMQNEHIAQVMDIGVLDNGAPYFVMEYLEGIDLKRLLDRHGPLEVPVAVNFVVQACEGIAEAHARDVLHRDLKPSNLMLTRRYDGSDLIKVLDFGVSKARLLDADNDNLTVIGTVLGSPAYMAPERLEGELGAVDGRTDVWSLAVILYELLVGRPPEWDSSQAITPLRSHRSSVPPALEGAILRALKHDQQERTPDVAALAADLLKAIPNEPTATGRVSVERMRAALDHSRTSQSKSGAPGLAERYVGVDEPANRSYDEHATPHERKPIVSQGDTSPGSRLETTSVHPTRLLSVRNRNSFIALVIIIVITFAALACAILMR